MSKQSELDDSTLDDIVHDALGEVFCADCEHPRCLNKVKLYKQAIIDWHNKGLLQARIQQSWRCRELVEANRRNNDDGEYYGDIVLLDVDDLEAELSPAVEKEA